MEILKSILFTVALITAVMFALLVFLTGKGDAMSGGSSVRTTFKGKASFDDFISKLTFILGIAFMALMIGIDVINQRTATTSVLDPAMEQPANQPDAPEKPATEAPKPGTTGTTGTNSPGTTSTGE